ncbi:hypothetical protein V1477_006917 [Vespula maculifrons]|uniref:Uncharacterized protein n=1 Tax=Vespula maculifrons TaxID=7453 RepID=A0ABD2CH41_VESMC
MNPILNRSLGVIQRIRKLKETFQAVKVTKRTENSGEQPLKRKRKDVPPDWIPEFPEVSEKVQKVSPRYEGKKRKKRGK